MQKHGCRSRKNSNQSTRSQGTVAKLPLRVKRTIREWDPVYSINAFSRASLKKYLFLQSVPDNKHAYFGIRTFNRIKYQAYSQNKQYAQNLRSQTSISNMLVIGDGLYNITRVEHMCMFVCPISCFRYLARPQTLCSRSIRRNVPFELPVIINALYLQCRCCM